MTVKLGSFATPVEAAVAYAQFMAGKRDDDESVRSTPVPPPPPLPAPLVPSSPGPSGHSATSRRTKASLKRTVQAGGVNAAAPAEPAALRRCTDAHDAALDLEEIASSREQIESFLPPEIMARNDAPTTAPQLATQSLDQLQTDGFTTIVGGSLMPLTRDSPFYGFDSSEFQNFNDATPRLMTQNDD